MPNYVAPIVDLDRGFRIWLKSEIYTGPNGTGVYVPNVDDLVLDWVAGFFRVVSINPTSYIAVLTPHNFLQVAGVDPEHDVFLGGGPGTISDSFRIHVNDSVVPHSVGFDSRVFMYPVQASYVRIFKGTDVSVTGQVISAMYDQSMNFIDDKIPLILRETTDENGEIKAPALSYTSESLVNGELLTAVVYSAEGHALSENRFLVNKTAFIPALSAAQRHIEGIEIVSPFLSDSNNRRIEFPLNLTLSSIQMRGKVTYNDGQSFILPIDGNKFELLGASEYINTIPGQVVPLVLVYRMSNNEANYIAGNVSPPGTIAEAYSAASLIANGSYSVKLFIFPKWDVFTEQYQLQYYLYNLDRQLYYNVTNIIETDVNASPFDPLLMNTFQHLRVAVDLVQINNSMFTEYRHVQNFTVALMHRGDDRDISHQRWQVKHDASSAVIFGDGIAATCEHSGSGPWTVSLSCGQETKEAWLQKLYYGNAPLRNPNAEQVAIAPTHFRLFLNGNTFTEYSINSFPWGTEDPVTVQIAADALECGELVRVHFITRTGSTDLQVGVAALPFIENVA